MVFKLEEFKKRGNQYFSLYFTLFPSEILQSACIPNPCDNEADCQDANGTAVCECRDGFGDLYCQTGNSS